MSFDWTAATVGSVLILVVMEYTQWGLLKLCYATQRVVLILVVMEYTQWVLVFTALVITSSS